MNNIIESVCQKTGSNRCIGGAAILTLLVVAFFAASACAGKNLQQLTGFPFEVYYSAGAEERAQNMAERCNQTISFYENRLGVKPEIQLYVLNPDDWQKYAGNVVYGMPHHSNGKLIIASQDNKFWRSFVPPVDKLPEEMAAKITGTYSTEDGNLTMQPFFDLVAIHELGHAFHFHSGLNMQRRWLSELFANLFLHNYIAEKEPSLLPEATIFPNMVLSTTNTNNLTFTSLDDFENRYDEIAKKHPGNYGWYQCKLIDEAARLYNAGGTEEIEKLWYALENQKSNLSDDELAELLAEKVNQQLANVLLKWEE